MSCKCGFIAWWYLCSCLSVIPFRYVLVLWVSVTSFRSICCGASGLRCWITAAIEVVTCIRRRLSSRMRRGGYQHLAVLPILKALPSSFHLFSIFIYFKLFLTLIQPPDGIAAATVGSILNYLLLGLAPQIDRFYLHSFEILLACTVVFPGVGNVGYTLLEYRLGQKNVMGALFENLRWIPFLWVPGLKSRRVESYLTSTFL